jgi:hypothetical protein
VGPTLSMALRRTGWLRSYSPPEAVQSIKPPILRIESFMADFCLFASGSEYTMRD